MMEAAAKVCGAATIGVILTGMGRDGADGMKAIKEAGGMNIAQSPETCVVFGMPKEAIELGVVDKILPVDRIATDLENITKMNEVESA
jgi:two-component system chemotaxis response regulator CheB